MGYRSHSPTRDTEDHNNGHNGNGQKTLTKAEGEYLATGKKPKDWDKPGTDIVGPLDTFDLADLLTEDFPPLKWIIPDILPEGLALFFSRPKIGKSMLALMIALRMARRVTGGIDGKALYLTLDDISKRRLKERALDLLQGQELEKGRVYCGTRAGRLDTGLMQQLGMWFNGHPDTRLVIIDVYARVKPGRKDNDIFKGDYDALIQLQEFAVEHHCAIILVHHTRKQMDTQDWINNVNGSTGLTAAPDTIWTLRRPRDSYAMELQVTGRDTEDGTICISLDDLDLPWEPKVEDEDTEYVVSGIESRILKALENSDRALYPREVASLIGAKSVWMAMRRMLKKKLINQEMKSGPYSLLGPLVTSSKSASGAALEQNTNILTSEYTSQFCERSTAANATSSSAATNSSVDISSMTRSQLLEIVKDDTQPKELQRSASTMLVDMGGQKVVKTPNVASKSRSNTQRKGAK